MLCSRNSPAGASAVTTGGFAYGGMTGKSVAVTLESNNASGYYTNGTLGSGSLSTSPISPFSGDPIYVTLTYSGTTLQENLLDTKTAATYSTSFLILTKFPALLGASTAYVGITAASCYYGADQYFSNFSYSVLPGNANCDGRVDVNDLTIVLSDFGRSGMTWSGGDFNGDGKVDTNDLTILLSNFGATSNAPGNIQAVPEPSTVALLVASAACLFAFQRRRRAI